MLLKYRRKVNVFSPYDKQMILKMKKNFLFSWQIAVSGNNLLWNREGIHLQVSQFPHGFLRNVQQNVVSLFQRR